MPRHQCIKQDHAILNVLVDHQVTTAPRFSPVIGRVDPAKLFGTVKVLERRRAWLSVRVQQRWQELVRKRILQPSEAPDECFQPLR